MIITIDGPAGSGKSTLAEMLAKHFNMFYFNSGYMYRALAYVLITYYGYDEQKLNNPNIVDVKTCIESENLVYTYEQYVPKVYYKKEDITVFLKDIAMSRAASILGQNLATRNVIRLYEKSMGKANKNFVIDGRVAGSVIFPNADIKFYVTASEEVRAQRAYKLQQNRGKHISLENVKKQLEQRDTIDMNREYDKLVKPIGAIEIDTSNLSKNQMFQMALSHIKSL